MIRTVKLTTIIRETNPFPMRLVRRVRKKGRIVDGGSNNSTTKR